MLASPRRRGGRRGYAAVMGQGDDGARGWRDDPDLARLERLWHAERRAEAAEYERLAALDLERNRRLTDVARELCHRGDVVAVTAGGRTFTGTVVAAVGDLARIRSPAAEVDLNLAAPVHLRVVERVREGGTVPVAGAESFRARLAEHEAAGEVVELAVTRPGGTIVARIRAASLDHVVLEADGQVSYLSIAAVEAVVRPRR